MRSCVPQCLQQRAKREGFDERLAVADIGVGCVEPGRAEEFLDQPRLADPGLALHDDEGRRIGGRPQKRVELILPADQDRRGDAALRPRARSSGALAALKTPRFVPQVLELDGL